MRGDRDVKLAADLAAGVMEAKKRRKAVGGIGAVWAELTAEILGPSPSAPSSGKKGDAKGGTAGNAATDRSERATVQSFARGVLTIAASDSATRYEIDRWLRAGGLEVLRKRAPATLTRVKIV